MAAKKKKEKHAGAKKTTVVRAVGDVDCRNSKPGDCPQSPAQLGHAVAAWAKAWNDWWIHAQEDLDDCPDIEVYPPNINYSVCRAVRAIHIDWCTWAEVLRKTQEACCPGPSGHIPPPPPPPF